MASLVPAAAVIPAPRAYVKVVAIKKKLVVGFLPKTVGPPSRSEHQNGPGHLFRRLTVSALLCVERCSDIYFEEIRVFQACACGQYISMEQ